MRISFNILRDRDGTETVGLKGDAPSAHDGLGKATPRFLGIPQEELIQAEIVFSEANRTLPRVGRR